MIQTITAIMILMSFHEMTHFFSVYKQLEGKVTAIDEVKGAEDAKEIIQESIDRYLDHFCK